MKLFHFFGEALKTKSFKVRIISLLLVSLGALIYFGYLKNDFGQLVLAKEADNDATGTNIRHEDFCGLIQSEEDGQQIKSISRENSLVIDLCREKKFSQQSTEEILVKEEEQRKKRDQENLHKKIEQIVANTPMQKMAEDIAGQEKIVAAFLVGIAMKESSFGKHSPRKNGRDCYNYWGYKGGHNPTGGGYSCFNSPEQAVRVVGKRIEKLVIRQGRNNPSKMIVWKCGSSCAGHDSAGVSKWIKDVSINFYKIMGA